jgi:hypothetical protein
MVLRGDDSGHTSGAGQSIGALESSIEPQFDQLAHALVSAWRIGGVGSRCMAIPFAWYDACARMVQ